MFQKMTYPCESCGEVRILHICDGCKRELCASCLVPDADGTLCPTCNQEHN